MSLVSEEKVKQWYATLGTTIKETNEELRNNNLVHVDHLIVGRGFSATTLLAEEYDVAGAQDLGQESVLMVGLDGGNWNPGTYTLAQQHNHFYFPRFPFSPKDFDPGFKPECGQSRQVNMKYMAYTQIGAQVTSKVRIAEAKVTGVVENERNVSVTLRVSCENGKDLEKTLTANRVDICTGLGRAILPSSERPLAKVPSHETLDGIPLDEYNSEYIADGQGEGRLAAPAMVACTNYILTDGKTCSNTLVNGPQTGRKPVILYLGTGASMIACVRKGAFGVDNPDNIVEKLENGHEDRVADVVVLPSMERDPELPKSQTVKSTQAYLAKHNLFHGVYEGAAERVRRAADWVRLGTDVSDWVLLYVKEGREEGKPKFRAVMGPKRVDSRGSIEEAKNWGLIDMEENLTFEIEFDQLVYNIGSSPIQRGLIHNRTEEKFVAYTGEGLKWPSRPLQYADVSAEVTLPYAEWRSERKLVRYIGNCAADERQKAFLKDDQMTNGGGGPFNMPAVAAFLHAYGISKRGNIRSEKVNVNMDLECVIQKFLEACGSRPDAVWEFLHEMRGCKGRNGEEGYGVSSKEIKDAMKKCDLSGVALVGGLLEWRPFEELYSEGIEEGNLFQYSRKAICSMSAACQSLLHVSAQEHSVLRGTKRKRASLDR